MKYLKQASKELFKLYEENEAFRTYVDKYAIRHDININEALQHKIIVNYAEDINGGNNCGKNK